jgi:hypothetical protein
MKKKFTVLFSALTLLMVPSTFGGDLGAGVFTPRHHDNDIPKAWKLSLIPLAASQALDISSSYGRRELNPALADSNGRFGAQSAAMKLGITAGVAGIEYLIVRAHPGAAKILWKMNLASAGITGAVAAHNYSLR